MLRGAAECAASAYCVDYLFGFRLLSTTYNLNSNEVKDEKLMGQTMTEGRLLEPLFRRFS
jgi:hypothetical protein